MISILNWDYSGIVRVYNKGVILGIKMVCDGQFPCLQKATTYGGDSCNNFVVRAGTSQLLDNSCDPCMA
jgi:hypothetical protein